MARGPQIAKKEDWRQSLQAIKEQMAGPKTETESKTELKLVPKIEGPKTIQEAESLATEEGLTTTEQAQITEIREVAKNNPEVIQSEQRAVTQLAEAKSKKKKGISDVIQKPSEAPEVKVEIGSNEKKIKALEQRIEDAMERWHTADEKQRRSLKRQIDHDKRKVEKLKSTPASEETSEPVEPQVKAEQIQIEEEAPVSSTTKVEKPSVSDALIDEERQRLETKIQELEAKTDRLTDDDMVLRSWKKKLNDYNRLHPVVVAEEKKTSPPPTQKEEPKKEWPVKIEVIKSSPTGVRFTANKFGGIRVEPKVIETLRTKTTKTPVAEVKVAEPELVEKVEPVPAVAPEAPPKELKTFDKKDWDLLVANLNDPDLGPDIWGVLGSMRKAIGHISGLEKRLASTDSNDQAIDELKEQIRLKKIELESNQPEFMRLVNKIKNPEPAAKTSPLAESIRMAESEVLSAETSPPSTEVPATEPTPSPEYQHSIEYGQNKAALEMDLSVLKGQMSDEWTDLYAEAGGFDKELWSQLKRQNSFGENEQKRFQDLKINLTDYAIKHLEIAERLKSILHDINVRSEKLEDSGLTEKAKESLERELGELKYQEKDTRREILGIEDMRNKDKAEEKGLLIMAKERLAESIKRNTPKTPSVRVAATTPEVAASPDANLEPSEEELMTVKLFEVNDKIREVEKALQAQREVMPQAMGVRGAGLEGDEEAIKKTEKIMKHYKVIKDLEGELAELQSEKDVLMGKNISPSPEKKPEAGGKESHAARMAKKLAIGAGVGGGGILAGLGLAFAKLEYWARWDGPLKMLEFLMKVTSDPGGLFKKAWNGLEKTDPVKLLEKKNKETKKE
jgi:hypothetical protein